MKKLSALLFITFLFSACGKTETEDTTPENPATPVSAMTISAQEITPTVSVSGTLRPAIESIVAAESAGTVAQIFSNEGDPVEIGSPLLSFSTGDNLAAADLSAASLSLQNAEKSLRLAQEKSRKDEEVSALSIRNAERNLESARKSNTSTGTSVEAQKSSAESAVHLAKISLENAEQNLKDLQANLNLSSKNLAENALNTKATAFANFRPAMTTMDEILGVSDTRRNDNDAFESLLGFRDPTTYRKATDSLRQIWNSFATLDAKFSANPKSVSLEEALAFAEKIRAALQKTDEMLQKTIDGAGLSATTLSGFQTSISTRRNTIESQIVALTATMQAITDFETTKPQSLRSTEAAVESAKEQLTQAEKGLTQTQSGGDLSLVNTETAITNAENALETAKIQAEITKKQNKINIQSATSARDSAASALTSAKIRYGKLSPSSPTKGVVIEKSVDIGDTVSAGTPLFVVAQIDSLKLTADVPIEVLPQISLNDPAKITVDVFGERIGKITKIFPVADSATRRVNLEISLENPAGEIPANIFATATIHLPVKTDAILIPRAALISNNPPTVFIVLNNKATKREIALGSDSGKNVEVLNGLALGDIIIPEPILGLSENDEVSITNDKLQIINKEKESSSSVQEKKLQMTNDELKNQEQEAEIEDKKNDDQEKNSVVQKQKNNPKDSGQAEMTNSEAEVPTKSLEENSVEITLEKPTNGEKFSATPIGFYGKAPNGAASMWINGYRLSSFRANDLSFRYFADFQYNNLQNGENHYVIVALDANGKEIARKEITIFFEK